MNRSTLIKKIAGRFNAKEKEVQHFIKAWEEEVENALIQEGEVVLMGFGTFTIWKQAGRPGRNPRENTVCMIAPRNSVKFKPGKLLLRHLNGLTETTDENNKDKSK